MFQNCKNIFSDLPLEYWFHIYSYYSEYDPVTVLPDSWGNQVRSIYLNFQMELSGSHSFEINDRSSETYHLSQS